METIENKLSASFGETQLPPVSSNPQRVELGQRMDKLFSMNGRSECPSEWLNGAVFVSQPSLRANIDWVPQAAHSLREILYRLCSIQMGGGRDRAREFFEKYGSAQDVETSLSEVNEMWAKLCAVAHHEKDISELPEGDFDTLFASFERVMNAALERQLDVHKEIDDLLANPPQ